MFQGSWKGFPLESPDVAFNDDGNMYVSWNGAKELRSWVVERLESVEEDEFDNWEIGAEF